MFDLKPDPKGRRLYANVSNAVEVQKAGRSHFVALSIPAELFTMMREVFRVTPDETVSLALDFEDRLWFFSMLVSSPTSGDRLYDLWTYQPSRLPTWVNLREHHC